MNYITQLRHTPDPTRGAIKTVVRALAWHHNTSLTSGPDPLLTPLLSVMNYRQAIEESFPDTDTKRRLPLTKLKTRQIRLIATTAYKWSTSGRPEYYRLFILIILFYKAATRILQLTRKDIVITKDYIRFNFSSRKNKKRRDPSIRLLRRLGHHIPFLPHKNHGRLLYPPQPELFRSI